MSAKLHSHIAAVVLALLGTSLRAAGALTFVLMLLAAAAWVAAFQFEVAPRPNKPAAAAAETRETRDMNESVSVLPKQFLLFDTVAVHTEDAQMMNVPGFGHLPTFTRSQTIPANWKEPVDFADGSFRIRYEVLEKTNRRKIHFCIVMTSPPGAKFEGHLPSHPGSRDFTEPGIDIEEGPIRKHFSSTYGGTGKWADWDWTKPFGRLWQDSYRQGSSQYGPSAAFPVKVRTTMWVVAKGFTYHPHGNYGEVDFRNLRFFAEGADLISRGLLGEALMLAEKALSQTQKGRLEEARQVIRGLTSHAEQRFKEIKEYWREDADYATDEMKELAELYRGHPVGTRIAAEAAALNSSEVTARCRRAREIWRRVLAESNKIEVPVYVGTEKWDEFVLMPQEVQMKYAAQLTVIKSGIDEMLSVYTAQSWKRMAMNLLHNLGQKK